MLPNERVRRAFQSRFRGTPEYVVRAPGRVNLIGEHTDYNDGFVLPMAIEYAVWIALRPRRDRQVLIHSLDYEQTVSFSIDRFRHGKKRWGEYIKGVTLALRQAGYALGGWEGVMCGNVPIGAGLSSSAATEMAAASAFAAASGLHIPAREMALAGQRAENDWVGVNCGIMDQMASAAAVEGHALFLDCRTLETQDVPLPGGIAIVIMDTATRRGLVETAYNERRAQCEAAAQHFGAAALRDVSAEMLEQRGSALDDVTLRRARHVVTENARVLAAVAAMQRGDASQLGALFTQSHISLRDDFEVTNDALNQIVEAALAQPGCLGARMTGAGFGGCAVALVESSRAEDFSAGLKAAYLAVSARQPALYVCSPVRGAGRV